VGGLVGLSGGSGGKLLSMGETSVAMICVCSLRDRYLEGREEEDKNE
jgi:hypothetical protein